MTTMIPADERHFWPQSHVFVVWGTIQSRVKRHFLPCKADFAFAKPGFAAIYRFGQPSINES